jgi:hypothetical protein
MSSSRRSQKPRAAFLPNRHRKLDDSLSWWWTDRLAEGLMKSFVEGRASMDDVMEKVKRLLHSMERDVSNEVPPFEKWLRVSRNCTPGIASTPVFSLLVVHPASLVSLISWENRSTQFRDTLRSGSLRGSAA